MPPPPPNSLGDGAVSAGPPSFANVPNANLNGQTNANASSARIPGISMANVDEIQTNPFQPRREFDEAAIEELAQSIRTNGIIQPLVVRKTAEGYQLIAGERRLRASKLAGLKQIPIVIRRSSDREAMEVAIIENIQRQDLNCVDEALAYMNLLREHSLTQEEVAERLGKDRATIANFLRILRLPDQIIQDLRAEKYSFGHAKAILGLEDDSLRMKIREQILAKGWSVRETEAAVLALKSPDFGSNSEEKITEKTPIQKRFAQLSQDLTHHWSAKVEIKGTEKKGKITFSYGSRSELDRILDQLQNRK
jgi:ParB family transcriptional regulator, chromosome partitioning protein